MAYQHWAVAAIPAAMFLLWLVVGREVTGENCATGIAVALAIGAWAPLIDF
jgi:hypothetical protein